MCGLPIGTAVQQQQACTIHAHIATGSLSRMRKSKISRDRGYLSKGVSCHIAEVFFFLVFGRANAALLSEGSTIFQEKATVKLCSLPLLKKGDINFVSSVCVISTISSFLFSGMPPLDNILHALWGLFCREKLLFALRKTATREMGGECICAFYPSAWVAAC